MAPDFRARLDRRVERGFERALPRRRFASLRPDDPALAVAGCVLAALVAVVLSAGGGSTDGAGSGGSGTAAPLAAQEQSSDSAKSGGGSASSGSSGSASTPALAAPAPGPAAPARQRRVERSTPPRADHDRRAGGQRRRRARHAGGRGLRAVLAGRHGRRALDRLVRAAVPSGHLDDALARLSKLGHVRSLQQSADDITNAYNGASRAWPRRAPSAAGCCARWPRRRPPQEISSLRARIADNRRALQRYQREFDAVRNRANSRRSASR
jgi:hypothetical protein